MANVHRAGALLFFVSGVVYMILQCVISYYTSPYGASVTLCRVRVSFTVIAVLAFLPSILSFNQRGNINYLSPIACPLSFFIFLSTLIDNSAVTCFFLMKMPPFHQDVEDKVRPSPSQQKHNLVSNGFEFISDGHEGSMALLHCNASPMCSAFNFLPLLPRSTSST